MKVIYNPQSVLQTFGFWQGATIHHLPE